MASYVAMKPPGLAEGAERAVLIRDGFSFLAFLVPPLWLVWHRLWIEAAFALAASMALTALGEVVGFGLTAPLLSLLVSLYVGLEGSAIRVAALSRRGWTDLGVVVADDAADAEARLFTGITTLTEAAPAPSSRLARPPASARPLPSGPALGLLHYPGKP